MKNCKNYECDKEIPDNRTYCSLTCRNVYVNKHCRDYSKNGKALSDRAKIPYLKNPKRCENPSCGKELPYKQRGNKYCCNSCAATIGNLGLDRSNNILSKEGYENIVKANRKRAGEGVYEKYESNPKLCQFCGVKIPFNFRHKKFCNHTCRKSFLRKDKTELAIYKRDASFNFNLKNYPEEFDFSLIEQYGWYKAKNRGDNLNGVSRDHMFSVNEGFKLGIDAKIIAHPANCKLMQHNDNSKKWKHSSITIDELLKRIEEWDSKYGIKA